MVVQVCIVLKVMQK
uniref:Uncharacterized protein n=1 Tax=Arundo donax TaxID=35708 RepID=A0A0A9BS36_ARUDO